MNQELNDYLKLVESRKANLKTYDVPMPSGAIWRHTPINIQQYAVSGKIPMHLVSRLPSVKNAPASQISQEEMVKIGIAAMEITRDVILNNLVFPRVTLEPTAESITPEQIDPEDFDYFLTYVMSGGQSAAKKKS